MLPIWGAILFQRRPFIFEKGFFYFSESAHTRKPRAVLAQTPLLASYPVAARDGTVLTAS
jgi:hypothetical protein